MTMIRHGETLREAGLCAKFCAVSLIGFATDACLLRLGLMSGLHPDWARAISLFCAMQATFSINGLLVFRCLERSRLLGQWAGYMTTNGLGNLCNYWIFLTLVSTHWTFVSAPMVAMTLGSVTAAAVNYVGTRLLVFGRGGVPAALKVVAAQSRREVCGPGSDVQFRD